MVTLKVMQVVLLALAANATMALAAEAAVSVIAGDATGTPGALVTVSVSLNPGGALVAGVQNDLEFDPGDSAILDCPFVTVSAPNVSLVARELLPRNWLRKLVP